MNGRFKIALAALLAIMALWSCKQGDFFIIEGSIESAEGDTLYLEHRGLAGIAKLDSVVLKEGGHFSMKQPVPANPEFYQLRIRDQVVLLTVESTDTLIVNADGENLYQSLKIADSPANDQLRQVDALVLQATEQVLDLNRQYKAKEIDIAAFMKQFDSLFVDYKKELSTLILTNPASAVAYYAVFQKIDAYTIFDPYEKQDYTMYAAVATSWNLYYPETERTKHLYDFVMDALRVRKEHERYDALMENIPVMEEAGLPDIELKEVNGERVALSSLKGKVVVLDFVVYNAEFSPGHNMSLNTIYSQYKAKGMEIYQVSFDPDEHFWKTSADNLPWITVRDPETVNSTLLGTYNVSVIPTAFVIDRQGDIVKRIEDYKQLAAALEKVL